MQQLIQFCTASCQENSAKLSNILSQYLAGTKETISKDHRHTAVMQHTDNPFQCLQIAIHGTKNDSLRENLFFNFFVYGNKNDVFIITSLYLSKLDDLSAVLYLYTRCP